MVRGIINMKKFAESQRNMRYIKIKEDDDQFIIEKEVYHCEEFNSKDDIPKSPDIILKIYKDKQRLVLDSDDAKLLSDAILQLLK